MKFGFIIPHNYGLSDPQDVLDIAVKAEELGFDSVWVNHHVLHAGYILDRLGGDIQHILRIAQACVRWQEKGKTKMSKAPTPEYSLGE